LLNVALLVLLPGLRYRSIVVHHSAGPTGDRQEIFDAAHRRRFLLDTAYHFVLSNGSTVVPAGHLESTRWYRWSLPSPATGSLRHNLTGIHLCIVGNYETAEMTGALKPALGNAIVALQRRYGIPDERVLLHRDCSATLCPGRNITRDRLVAWGRDAGPGCSESTRRQHASAIEGPYVAGGPVSWAWLGLAVTLSGLAVAVWLKRAARK
jgi:hypothetical protein